MVEQIFKNIKDILVVILSIGVIALYINNCEELDEHKLISESNITALTDSVNVWKAKNENLVFEKSILVSDIEVLKQTNASLYDDLKSMNMKNADLALQLKAVAEIPNQDTLFIVESSSNTIYRKFDFSDTYRTLKGSVWTNKADSIMINIEKDLMHLDYTLALKGNKVHLQSNNPYVKLNEIQGVTVPKNKDKKWGIGPSITLGYDFGTKEPIAAFGISITYSLLEW